jgi:2-amino-4-hydroxy-6-hydroxymethyldihydropteridine diphosphokinase
MDRIIIKDLLIRGIIGISERERAQRQDILVNIVLYGDIHPAGKSDNINDCINYRTVAKKTIAYVERSAGVTVEALGSDIARFCLEEPGVAGVQVRVEKPGAVRFAQSVGVEIERFRTEGEAAMHQAYVSLGSNLNPRENILEAMKRLRQAVTVNTFSTIWETEAVGTTGPRFLNAAAWISTPLAVDGLKAAVLGKIEQELGRVRTSDKNATRTIDLDIIVYDEQVLDLNLWKRDFLAIPIAELRPDLEVPGEGITLNQVAQSLRATSTAVPRLDLTIPDQSQPGIA